MSAKNHLEALLGLVGEPVLLTGPDRKIAYVSPLFPEASGLEPRQVLGRDLFEIWQDKLKPPTTLVKTWMGSVTCPGKEGGPRHFQLLVSPVGPDGNGGLVALLRSPESETQSHAGRLGNDPLTGLPNRHLFADRLDQGVLAARRSKSTIALALAGLDRFALINEGFGMKTGDAVLKEIGRRLRSVLRGSDTAARLDGDLFSLMLPLASPDDVVVVAEKLLRTLREPVAVDGKDIGISASIGLSLFPNDAGDVDNLFKRAAAALQTAKSGGRNRYHFHSGDFNDKARLRLDTETRLRRALAENQLVLHYLPKVHVDSDSLVGMEALVRWQDPKHGLIMPADFIPVIEDRNLINDIGQWVMETACRQTRLWQFMELVPVRLAVNVTPQQFRSPDFVQRVWRALSVSGLDGAYLEIDVNEEALAGDVDSVVARMNELRGLGIGISIDDFGTGYTSLSFLSRFPITSIKIDRAIIAEVENDPNTAEIARTIIDLSKGLNIEVVAEGAEAESQVDFLRENGCTSVQGFFYSQPLPADEFQAYLGRETAKALTVSTS
ncbi:MAG: EAL domain-containing protein [Rhodospirillales bacterium]|nr:EAL domain-containing protein [Rhodospirillales bacterium]